MGCSMGNVGTSGFEALQILWTGRQGISAFDSLILITLSVTKIARPILIWLGIQILILIWLGIQILIWFGILIGHTSFSHS